MIPHLVCLLAVAAAQEPASPTPEERLRPIAQELAGRPGVPGASLAAVLPGGELVAVAAGVADLETKEALETGDRMLLGSVGKTVVAANALRLAAADKLDLDARVKTLLGNHDWYRRIPNADTITVRQLLQHTTGIPRYVFDPEFFEALTDHPNGTWKPHERLEFVLDDEPLFAAGENFAYADTNYILVGMILEKLGRGDFYGQVQKHFLKPLELEDTIPSDRRRLPGVVQGHVVEGRVFDLPERTLDKGVFVFNPQFEWCGGGFASTPSDLARWARALYRGEALGVDYLEELLDPVPIGPGTGYGLGVFVRETAAGPLHGHDGFMPGYLTSMAYFPELEIAVAVQLNTDDTGAIGGELFEVLVKAALALGDSR